MTYILITILVLRLIYLQTKAKETYIINIVEPNKLVKSNIHLTDSYESVRNFCRHSSELNDIQTFQIIHYKDNAIVDYTYLDYLGFDTVNPTENRLAVMKDWIVNKLDKIADKYLVTFKIQYTIYDGGTILIEHDGSNLGESMWDDLETIEKQFGALFPEAGILYTGGKSLCNIDESQEHTIIEPHFDKRG